MVMQKELATAAGGEEEPRVQQRGELGLEAGSISVPTMGDTSLEAVAVSMELVERSVEGEPSGGSRVACADDRAPPTLVGMRPLEAISVTRSVTDSHGQQKLDLACHEAELTEKIQKKENKKSIKKVSWGPVEVMKEGLEGQKEAERKEDRVFDGERGAKKMFGDGEAPAVEALREAEAQNSDRRTVGAGCSEGIGAKAVPEEYVDGLVCGGTGKWRPYSLVSEKGLSGGLAPDKRLVRFRNGNVQAVPVDWCRGFEASLVGKDVDEGVWRQMRGKEQVKPHKVKASAEAVEAARLKAEEDLMVPVRMVMLMALGLRKEELEDEAVRERVRDDEKQRFWLQEYQMRLLEAGGLQQLWDWFLFQQGLLGRAEAYERVTAAKGWMKVERKLMREEQVRQEVFLRKQQQQKKEAELIGLWLKMEGGDWKRAGIVRWSPKGGVLSSALAKQLGARGGAKRVKLAAKLVCKATSQSKEREEWFEVVEDEDPWVQIRGLGPQQWAESYEQLGPTGLTVAAEEQKRATAAAEKQPAAKQSCNTPEESHQGTAVRISEGSRATHQTTADEPSPGTSAFGGAEKRLVESTMPDETWHALGSGEKEKGEDGQEIKSTTGCSKIGIGDGAAGDGRLASGAADSGSSAFGGAEKEPNCEKPEGHQTSKEQSEVEEQLGLSLRVRCPVSGQWILAEGAVKGQSMAISRWMAASLGCNLVEGRALLQAKLEGEPGDGESSWFEVLEADEPSFVWAGKGPWRRMQPRRPSAADGCSFEAEYEVLQMASEEDEQEWWRQKAAEAEKNAQLGGAEGALWESSSAQPDGDVLGSWLRNEVQPEGHAFDYQRDTDSPEELRSRPSVFVAGGMILKPSMYQKWKAAGAPEQILQWIQEGGYKVRVTDEGRGLFFKNGSCAREHEAELAVLVCELLMKESWEVVSERVLRQTGNILPMNLAPKPSKDPPWRIVNNCMKLNEHVQKWRTRYESLKTLGIMIEKDSWIFSIDLEDAYYSFLLHPDSRSIFGAKAKLKKEQLERLKAAGLWPEGRSTEDQEVCLQPRGLPMGFTNSCAIWTSIQRVLTRMWRSRGWKCCGYIDDFLFIADTKEEAEAMLEQALKDIEGLGLAPSYKKTVTPCKRLKFLGILVDTTTCCFYVPGEKVEQLKELAVALKNKDEASIRELAKVAGKLISMSVAVPAVRLCTAECYRLVRPQNGDYDEEVVITEEVREELAGLLQHIEEWNRKGASFKRSPSMQELRIICDAGTGWGYRLDGDARQLEMGERSVGKAGEWTDEELELWQPWKELLAVEKAISERAEELQGRNVLLLTDATAVVRYINKGSGPSDYMTKLMRKIFKLCVRWGISLHADHMAGELMKVSGVDSLSRWGEFAVSPKVFKSFQASARWGKFGGAKGYGMDLYASRKTAKCKAFCARGAAEGALGDARSWVCDEGVNHWVCPPLVVVDKAVRQFVEAGCLGTVVVPDWTNQPWHLYLREHAVHSVALPWRQEEPTMRDAASKGLEAHGVNKFAFRAFLIDGRVHKNAQAAVQASACEGKRRKVLPCGKRLLVDEVDEVLNGVRLGSVVQERELRALDLFSGLGSVPWMLQRLGVKAKVFEVEIDEAARRCAAQNAPGSVQLTPHDVWYWASEEGLKRLMDMNLDLITAGFPCQSVSSAAPAGQGLRGKSGVFEALRIIVEALTEHNPHIDFLIECVDFSTRHAEDFNYVSESLGVEPVVMCASDLSACYRRRAYWATFSVEEIRRVEVDPNSVLEPGRKALWSKLPTVVASGTRSWNTRWVVEEEGVFKPLEIEEMERAMQYDVGYTDVEGLQLQDRHRLVGNAFHAGVLRHVLLNYITSKAMKDRAITRNDVRARGIPFVENQDGPKWQGKQFSWLREARQQSAGSVLEQPQRVSSPGRILHPARLYEHSCRLGLGALKSQTQQQKGARGQKASYEQLGPTGHKAARAPKQRHKVVWKQPTAKQSCNTLDESHQGAAERISGGSRVTHRTTADEPSPGTSAFGGAEKLAVESTLPDETWHAPYSNRKEKGEDGPEIKSEFPCPKIGNGKNGAGDGRLASGAASPGPSGFDKAGRKPKQKGAVAAPKVAASKTQKKALWRTMVDGKPVQLQQRPEGMHALWRSRAGGAGKPKLLQLQWHRARDKPKAPKGGAGLSEFARELADDLAIKSKSEATWKSYAGWWDVLLAFAQKFGLELEEAEPEERIELVRLAVSMLSTLYAWGTIDVFTCAASYYFKSRGWKSFYEDEMMKATLQGIKRELGLKAKKKPPVEPWHLREILQLECPEGCSGLQWRQSKALLMLGFMLFNRRQDFGRLQPCDLRPMTTKEGEPRVWEVLIRYAKNDLRGLTRAPRLEEAEQSEFCVLKALEQYMQAADIKVHPSCNKVWGQPYACDFCEPLFPSIWANGGKKSHAMPDSRVALVVKQAFRALAAAKPDLMTPEEAEAFSTKSLRTGGVSSAAAEEIRDGVLQGHGGWLARASLVHYDQMKDAEKQDVPKALSKAIARMWGDKPGEVQGQQDVPQSNRERVRSEVPRAQDSDTDGEADSEVEAAGAEKHFKILGVLNARKKHGHQQFQVEWAPCAENGHKEELTWEFELDLREDGQGGLLDVYLVTHTRAGKPRVQRRGAGQVDTMA